MTQDRNLDNDIIEVNTGIVELADDWEKLISVWQMAQDVDNKNFWFKGDIVLKLTENFGETSLGKFAQDIGESPTTLETYRRVARAFPKDKRDVNIPWSHYVEASYADSYNKSEGRFETDNRFELLEKAQDEGWSAKRLRQEAKAISKGDVTNDYDRYADAIERFGNYLTHIDLSNMDSQQRQDLATKMHDVARKIQDYLLA